MSRAGSGDNPAIADARVNPPMPIRKSLRWPNLSPSRPPTTSRTPMASMYAGPSHLIRLSPPLSSPAMVGAAMFVTVASITSRASASSTSPRIAHTRRLERRAVTVPGSVKVVIRNVLLGSVGVPLLGDLSTPLRTPLTRSDTACEITFQTSGASPSGTHGDTDETGQHSYAEKGADHLGDEGVVVGLGQAGYGDRADDAHVLDADREGTAMRREQPWFDAACLVQRCPAHREPSSYQVGGCGEPVDDVDLALDPRVVLGRGARQGDVEQLLAVAPNIDRDQ